MFDLAAQRAGQCDRISNDPTERVLNCPQCGAQVADGTAICPSCDHILDDSFLNLDAPERNDDLTPAGPAPGPRRPTAAPRVESPVRSPTAPRLRPSSSRPPVRPATTSPRPQDRAAAPPGPRRPRPARPSPPPEADAAPWADEDEVDELDASPPPPARASRSVGRMETDASDWRGSTSGHRDDLSVSSTESPTPEQILADTWESLKALPRGDKLALGGVVLTLLLCFMPWKETAADGEVPGVLTQGLTVLIANAVALGAIIVRARSMPRIPQVIPWIAQLGALSFGLVWCFVFMSASSDGRLVQSEFGLEPRPVSDPAFGVYLSALSHVVALAGTVLGLKEKE